MMNPVNLTSILGDGIGSIELLSVNGNDKSVVNAARVSFGKGEPDEPFTERDAKLLKFLLQHEHGSPFEHNQLQFRVKAPFSSIVSGSNIGLEHLSIHSRDVTFKFLINFTFLYPSASNLHLIAKLQLMDKSPMSWRPWLNIVQQLKLATTPTKLCYRWVSLGSRPGAYLQFHSTLPSSLHATFDHCFTFFGSGTMPTLNGR